MGDVPAYVTKKRACAELDMSDDTFDKYVDNGTLPPAKERNGLKRWKWREIERALDRGASEVIELAPDQFDQGVSNAKAPSRRAA